MIRFSSMPNGRSSTDASSAFPSCDSIYSEDSDDDDCQVVGVRPPPRTAAAASPAASQKSRNSSWSAWEKKASGKRPGTTKAENGHVAPELVDDNQQNLRRQWEAATLRRRTCPPMRSEGSKAGTNGHWGSHAPQSGSIHRETDSSANLGGDSGTAETVQSNGHVSPAQDVSLHTLSSTSAADSVIEPRENGDAEPDEVASGSRKRPPPDQATSSNSVFREDPLESPPKFAAASPSKGFKRRYEPEDVTSTQLKLRTNGTDGASISGHGGINSLKHMAIGNHSARDEHAVAQYMGNGHQSVRDPGGLELALGSGIEQDLVGAKEKLKETAGFKLADEEEWARRQQELQKQVSARLGIPCWMRHLGGWKIVFTLFQKLPQYLSYVVKLAGPGGTKTAGTEEG
jgi:hypothetical protein